MGAVMGEQFEPTEHARVRAGQGNIAPLLIEVDAYTKRLTATLEAERAAHAATRARLSDAGDILGMVCVAATLRPFESLARPHEHAAIDAVRALLADRDRLHSMHEAEKRSHEETHAEWEMDDTERAGRERAEGEAAAMRLCLESLTKQVRRAIDQDESEWLIVCQECGESPHDSACKIGRVLKSDAGAASLREVRRLRHVADAALAYRAAARIDRTDAAKALDDALTALEDDDG
jgi:hypothetical protein